MAWAGNVGFALKSSPAVTAALVRRVNGNLPARIEIRKARLYPLYLTLVAEGVEIFDAEGSGSRVFSAARVTVRPSLFSWLRKGRDLSLLQVEQGEIEITKDFNGVFNWERLIRFKSLNAEDPLSGWKHQDWLFNFYERLRREAHETDRSKRPDAATRFQIARFRLNGRGMLIDRSMPAPLVVENLEIKLDRLKWLENGAVKWEALSSKGRSRSKQPSQFNLRLQWKGGEIRGAARLNQVNLEPLLPFYSSSSPVLFEKGYLTLRSELRLSADSIDSSHYLQVRDHQMRPTLPWSPESTVVLAALNRHPVLDIKFTIRGDPHHPVFDGVVESLMKLLKQDFDPVTLSLIRLRVQQEVEKLSLQFSPG